MRHVLHFYRMSRRRFKWVLGPCSDLRRLADGQYHPQLIQVLVGIAAVDEDPTSVAWANCGGSVGLVLDGLQETSMAHGFEFQFFIRHTTCDASDAVGVALDLMKTTNVDVVIAPPCHGGALMMSFLSTTYQTPLLLWGFVNDVEFADLNQFPYVTSVMTNAKQVAQAVTIVLEEFQWSTIAILYQDRLFDYCSSIVTAIELQIFETNTFSTYVAASSKIDVDDDVRMSSVLKRVKLKARIILVCFDSLLDRRKFLLTASEMGMMDDEYQYVVVAIRSVGFGQTSVGKQMLDIGLTPFWVDVDGLAGDGADNEVKEIARNILIIDLSTNITNKTELSDFQNTVRKRVTLPPMNCDTVPCRNSSDTGFGKYARHLRDLFYLYAKSLDVVGDRYKSAPDMVAAMVTSFQGLTGDVIIDEKHTRVPIIFLYGLDASYQQVTYAEIDFSGENSTLKKLYTDPTTIFGGRETPLSVPLCGFSGLDCLGSVFARNHRQEQQRLRNEWHVPSALLLGEMKSGSIIVGKSHRSLVSAKTALTSSDLGDTCFDIRYYLGEKVIIIGHKRLHHHTLEQDLYVKLRKLDHENVNKFVGLSADGPEFIAVWRMCERGTLQAVISAGTMTIDSFFVICLIKDIAEGIKYLHMSFLPYIGTLSSAMCLVSEGWQVKLSFFGLEHLAGESTPTDRLYIAPELLRNTSLKGTKQGDLYSFAIVCSEVITRRPAWSESESREEIEDLLYHIKRGGASPPRPRLERMDTDVDQSLIDIAKECWTENPNDRLAIDVVCSRLATIKQGSTKTNLMDHLFERLEVHTADLEREIEIQSRELVEHKKKADLLLGKMLPRQVAELLKRGQSVEPEGFDSVTVFFCDVVKFTQLAAKCLPLQVISLLNELFSSFDQIIEEHDAYKVESIGDGYLCVSGLPTRNGFNHIREILEMSFCLMEYLKTFRIPALPRERVELRIGINSGPCVAGVVGLSMPRYCLFGDTVNTASRMESNGKASHIHLSDTAQKLLVEHFPGQYETVSRGDVIIKGKGVMETFWAMRRIPPEEAKKPPSAASTAALRQPNEPNDS